MCKLFDLDFLFLICGVKYFFMSFNNLSLLNASSFCLSGHGWHSWSEWLIQIHWLVFIYLILFHILFQVLVLVLHYFYCDRIHHQIINFSLKINKSMVANCFKIFHSQLFLLIFNWIPYKVQSKFLLLSYQYYLVILIIPFLHLINHLQN